MQQKAKRIISANKAARRLEISHEALGKHIRRGWLRVLSLFVDPIAAKTMNAMHRANELKASVGVRECPSGGYVALTYLFVERSNAGRILIAFPNKAFHRPETLRPI